MFSLFQQSFSSLVHINNPYFTPVNVQISGEDGVLTSEKQVKQKKTSRTCSSKLEFISTKPEMVTFGPVKSQTDKVFLLSFILFLSSFNEL